MNNPLRKNGAPDYLYMLARVNNQSVHDEDLSEIVVVLLTLCKVEFRVTSGW